jgi:hypothetical protein
MPADRKCCPLDDVTLDVMPMLRSIVFDVHGGTNHNAAAHGMSSEAAGRSALPACVAHAALPNPSSSRQGGAKKTMLNLKAPSPTPLPPSTPCVAPRVRLNARDAEVLSAAYPLLTIPRRNVGGGARPCMYPEFVGSGITGVFAAGSDAPIGGGDDADDPIEDA